MIFINLEKTHDKILRYIMWWALEKKKVSIMYLTFIKDIYKNIMTSIRVCDGESNVFSIKIELHQGSEFNPYIFTLVMDDVTKNIQGDISWCIFFADDVVQIDKSMIRVNQKLEL
jgi:Reverse transcriptase (RNA-dependent DNA polymerase)